MKGLLLAFGVLALTGLPASAGTNVFVSIGGGFHGGSFSSFGSRCGYSGGYTPYRSYGYVGYPSYNYAGYGYYYGAYTPYYYPANYNVVSYAPTYAPQPTPAQAPEPAPAPASTPVPAPAPATTPAAAPMEFGILDVNGYVHSPYSDAVLKIPGVRNAQMVYDPVTGKPFLVR